MHGVDCSSFLPCPRSHADDLSKMYEFATDQRAFTPEATDSLPRDVVHLAQMTQLTGQDHDQAVLEQYEVREKQRDLKGRFCDLSHDVLFNFESRHVEAFDGRKCWARIY